jgi:hypothetical protein
MPKRPPFYSVNEAKKPSDHRVYHNSACPSGHDIPENERRAGMGQGEYALCRNFDRLNQDGR